jgi:hypothetical protein
MHFRQDIRFYPRKNVSFMAIGCEIQYRQILFQFRMGFFVFAVSEGRRNPLPEGSTADGIKQTQGWRGELTLRLFSQNSYGFRPGRCAHQDRDARHGASAQALRGSQAQGQ